MYAHRETYFVDHEDNSPTSPGAFVSHLGPTTDDLDSMTGDPDGPFDTPPYQPSLLEEEDSRDKFTYDKEHGSGLEKYYDVWDMLDQRDLFAVDSAALVFQGNLENVAKVVVDLVYSIADTQTEVVGQTLRVSYDDNKSFTASILFHLINAREGAEYGIVEIQRKDGCNVAFHNYRRIISVLVKNTFPDARELAEVPELGELRQPPGIEAPDL